MASKQKTSTKKQQNTQNCINSKNQDPLWKKFPANSKISFMTSSQTSQSTNDKKHITPKKIQPNIDNFLQKMHHKISDSVQSLQTEVVQRQSIQWNDYDPEFRNSPSNTILKSIFAQRSPSFRKKVEECGCEMKIQVLKQIRNLQEFLIYISQVNINLFTIITKLLENNKQLTQKIQSYQQLQIKNVEKMQILINQINMLERKNLKVSEDFMKLQRQVQFQVQIEQERMKYKYEQLIQKIKNEEIKVENIKIQTIIKNNSISNKLNQNSSMKKSKQDKDKLSVQNIKTFQSQINDIKKRNKLMRSSKTDRQLALNSTLKQKSQKNKNFSSKLNNSINKTIIKLKKSDKKDSINHNLSQCLY